MGAIKSSTFKTGRGPEFRATLVALVMVFAIVDSRAQSSTSEDSQEAGLEEIIVTAQRRDENVNKVPISITALSQRRLDELNIESLADLATIVPGVYITPPSPSGAQDYSSVAIRGILSSGNAPTTQFYIDETPIGIRQIQTAANSGSPMPQIFDLDRVEVLRGPQGTLFGASAMGGAIRFITPQPNLNDSSGLVKADVGYADGGNPSYQVGAAYGSPIVAGTLGFRVSVWYQSTGGFIDQEDPYTGQILKPNADTSDSYVIRPAFAWAPSEDLTITPALFLQHKHLDSPNQYWFTDLPRPEHDGLVWGGTAQPLTDDLRVPSLAIKYNIAGLSLQSDTSYVDREFQARNDITQAFDFAFGGNPVYPGLRSFHVDEEDITFTHAWQQEFRLSSQDPSSWLSWVAGAYYRNAVQDLAQPITPDLSPLTEAAFGQTSLQFFGYPDYIYNGEALNSYDNFRATDISEAVFADVSINLNSRLKADVGVRIEHEVVEHQNEVIAGPTYGVLYSSVVLPDQVANPVTPRVSLTYQYTDTDMIYVSAAKGYRPGGGNSWIADAPVCQPSLHAMGLSAAPTTYQPDSLWSYELGAKDLLFDRRVSIEGSVYYIDWKGIQTGITLPSPCYEEFTTNLGRAVSQGADLQVAAVVTDGLKLGLLAGYTDAYYPNAAYGAPVNGIRTILNLAGDKIPTLRPWTFDVNGEYSRDISSLWAGSRSYLRVDYRRLSKANSDYPDPYVANYDPLAGMHPDQAYALLSVRMGVTHSGLDVSAYVNNATNSAPLLGFNHFGSLYEGSTISPLTAGITAWYRF